MILNFLKVYIQNSINDQGELLADFKQVLQEGKNVICFQIGTTYQCINMEDKHNFFL